MEDLKIFFDLIYMENISLTHLDAIHDMARRILKREHSEHCAAFEAWYAENVYSDDE